MELTGEVLNTQFYDKVDGYTTLQYNVEIADSTIMWKAPISIQSIF